MTSRQSLEGSLEAGVTLRTLSQPSAILYQYFQLQKTFSAPVQYCPCRPPSVLAYGFLYYLCRPLHICLWFLIWFLQTFPPHLLLFPVLSLKTFTQSFSHIFQCCLSSMLAHDFQYCLCRPTSMLANGFQFCLFSLSSILANGFRCCLFKLA